MPEILIPREPIKLWAVVACDQFSSQKEYWDKVEQSVKDTPSAYHLIFPEAYLDLSGKDERIKKIHEHMKEYLSKKVFSEVDGFIFVKRWDSSGKLRQGLVVALDLEKYDYNKGSKSLIRPTEGTILDRIPPRVAIRLKAPLELPHIMVLIDDQKKTVIEPLAKEPLKEVYAGELMLGGGKIEGYSITDVKKIADIAKRIEALSGDSSLLYAVGDGNHSLATAKAVYEQMKEEGHIDHPSRYALVELVNVHDPGLVFEPIHRVLFDVDGKTVLEALHAAFKGRISSTGEHMFTLVTKQGEFTIGISHPEKNVVCGTVQDFLDDFLKKHKCRIDYVHGEDVVRSHAKGGCVGFLLPAMSKFELFPTVVKDGAFPRKTFSMGDAKDKRYYVEARRIS